MVEGLEIPPGKLLQDVHELPELQRLLGYLPELQVTSLNEGGWADYAWLDSGGLPHHTERKTWRELFDVDRVEEQLTRHLLNHPEAKLTLLVEGTPLPLPGNMTAFYKVVTNKKGKQWFIPAGTWRQPLQATYSFLYQVGKFCEVYFSSCPITSAIAISSFYKADQKPDTDHTTFRRHIARIEFHRNPQVSKLMSIAEGIGPTRAEAIIERFTVVWNVLRASPEELARVPGVGITTATKLLRQIGRSDV